MALMSRKNEFAAAICKELGLTQVRALTIHMRADALTVVTAELIPDDFSEPILKRFRLSAEPIEGGEPQSPILDALPRAMALDEFLRAAA